MRYAAVLAALVIGFVLGAIAVDGLAERRVQSITRRFEALERVNANLVRTQLTTNAEQYQALLDQRTDEFNQMLRDRDRDHQARMAAAVRQYVGLLAQYQVRRWIK